ncbi:hypothetical protein PUN28_013885 [Cardiocondyla obscurior]|uniref:Uncharacterized protein n=1 Tax=Cardiocondyla obscurior TaxID=286306 RepID=A0AAW2F3K4_9HYME
MVNSQHRSPRCRPRFHERPSADDVAAAQSPTPRDVLALTRLAARPESLTVPRDPPPQRYRPRQSRSPPATRFRPRKKPPAV